MKLLSYDGHAKVKLTSAANGHVISLPNGTEVCIIDSGQKLLRNQYAKKDDEVVEYDGRIYFMDHDDLEWRHNHRYRKPVSDQPET